MKSKAKAIAEQEFRHATFHGLKLTEKIDENSCFTAYLKIKSIWPSSELTLIETPDDSDKSRQEIEAFKKRGIRGDWRPKIRGENR